MPRAVEALGTSLGEDRASDPPPNEVVDFKT